MDITDKSIIGGLFVLVILIIISIIIYPLDTKYNSTNQTNQTIYVNYSKPRDNITFGNFSGNLNMHSSIVIGCDDINNNESFVITKNNKSINLTFTQFCSTFFIKKIEEEAIWWNSTGETK